MIWLLQLRNDVNSYVNSYSYSDISISHLVKIINEKRATQFYECFYFGGYPDDCLVLWCGDIGKLNDFYKILNTLDEK